MATYSCRLYINTGFNSINVPDTPALLEQMSFVDVPVLDLTQERFLPFVSVRASWDTVKNCDYCKVGTFYYYVPSIHQSSGDVAVLDLIPDFALSAGGFATLEILDGLTDRVHVTDDSYGIYEGDDPYMAPAYDLEVRSFVKSFDSSSALTFVETTLDLDSLGQQKQDNTTLALTAKDETDPDNPFTVTYPVVPMISDTAGSGAPFEGTKYYANLGGTRHALTYTKNQGLYYLGATQAQLVLDGISQARSLGVEQAISGQFSIPSDFVTMSSGAQTISIVSTLDGRFGTVATDIPFKYGTANNNRVFYGNFTPYTLVSCIGNTFSAAAEEIYDFAGGTVPSVSYIADPRREGKPYYRFSHLNRVSAAGNDFFRGSVAGKQWNNVPLVLSEKSGSVLDFVNYRNSMASNQMAAKQAKIAGDFGIASSAILGLSGAASGVGNAVISNASSKTPMSGGMLGASIATDLLQRTMSGLSSGEAAYMNSQFTQQRAALERAIESQQFQISQNVRVPDIRFTVDPDLAAEIYGNGFMVYRVTYRQEDISRIDKILTAYGYKHTKLLENTDFNNRTYFNYVSGSISVGNLPRWWADGIAAQLAGGVRVWHVKPSHFFYNNNPVVTPATPVTPVVGG